MKKRRPGKLKVKEPDANALDARMLNPAREPVLPDVLDTSASPADLTEDFVPLSAPLGERLKGGDEPEPNAEEKRNEKPREAEFFNPTTPLESKPKKFTAVHTRPQKPRRSAAEPPRRAARRTSR